ncbi:MAG: ABC transporter permease [bacterium]
MRRLFHSTRMWVAAIIVSLIISTSLAAPVLAPYSPVRQDSLAILTPPDAKHLLGTDSFGRDILSRLVWGGRLSLSVSFTASLLALLAGASIGLVTGFFGRLVDLVAMRFIDALMTFPSLLLALAILTSTGPSFAALILAIGLVYVAPFALLSRALTLREREREYVLASVACGSSDSRALLRHVLPNVLPALFVQFSITLPLTLLAESSLSFLGFSASPAAPSWGRMVFEASRFLHAPHAILAPTLSLSSLILSLNIVAISLREALDPTLRHAAPLVDRGRPSGS